MAVFCLALMGTDYPSFLREAARVLKPHGTIWIAEVRMRTMLFSLDVVALAQPQPRHLFEPCFTPSLQQDEKAQGYCQVHHPCRHALSLYKCLCVGLVLIR